MSLATCYLTVSVKERKENTHCHCLQCRSLFTNRRVWRIRKEVPQRLLILWFSFHCWMRWDSVSCPARFLLMQAWSPQSWRSNSCLFILQMLQTLLIYFVEGRFEEAGTLPTPGLPQHKSLALKHPTQSLIAVIGKILVKSWKWLG